MVYRKISESILILCLTGNAAAIYTPSAAQDGMCYTTAEGAPLERQLKNERKFAHNIYCASLCKRSPNIWWIAK